MSGIIPILQKRKHEVQGYINNLNYILVQSKTRIKPDSSNPNGHTLSTWPDNFQHCMIESTRETQFYSSPLTAPCIHQAVDNGCTQGASESSSFLTAQGRRTMWGSEASTCPFTHLSKDCENLITTAVQSAESFKTKYGFILSACGKSPLLVWLRALW